jgi:hypothetical protein
MNNTLNIFDASVISQTASEHEMTRDELVEELRPKLEDILKARFSGNSQKQQIKVYKDRISFAAPCCGDSAKDSSKKRGNIILEGKFKNMYKCHNCGTCMSMYNFFKRNGAALSIRAIDYVIANKADNTYDPGAVDSSMNLLYDTEIIDEFAIDREYFKEKCHLVECDNTATYSQANAYLRKRLQFNYKKFLYHPTHNLLFILNLTPSGKIIGLQVRNMNRYFTGPKYKTYKLSKIYSILLHEEREIPDNIENLSMVFNILLVNYNQPITVVEGPMDSFLIKNCVALCGAGHHMPFDLMYRYLYDDDKTGRKHAIEKLNEGYEVFMWDKLKADLMLPRKEKWDVNDLLIYCTEHKINIPPLANYYSSNNLDLLDI